MKWESIKTSSENSYTKYKLDIKEGAFMENQIFTANYHKKLPKPCQKN